MHPTIERLAIVYDVETQHSPDEVPGGWDNPFGMGFACAWAYEYRSDRYFFFHDESGRMGLLNLLRSRLAITWNGIIFDSRVLMGNDRSFFQDGYCGRESLENGSPACYFQNYDLKLEYLISKYCLDEYGQAIELVKTKPGVFAPDCTLDAIANATIRLGKNSYSGSMPYLWASGKTMEVSEHCLHDVRLIRRLFEYVINYHQITDGSGNVFALRQWI